MPTIKIVPMPGASVPGPQGPQGIPGPAGAGFEAVPVVNSQIAPGSAGVIYNLNCDTLPAAWTEGMSVRLTATSSLNGDPVSGNYVDGIIQQILPGRYNIIFRSSNSGGDWTVGAYDSWSMTLTGSQGAAGADADLGYLTITSQTDPVEGMTTTLEAPGNITIQSPTAPGLVTVQTYVGLQVNSHPSGGIYVNGTDQDHKVVTFADLSSATAFPSPVNWTPVVSGDAFTQASNPATGTYLKYGTMVVVNLFVPFTNVTNFGTGQYSVSLPFPAKQHADVFAGSIHNVGPSVDHYSLKGHLSTGSQLMTLWYISGSSKDEPFRSNAPINLNTTDLFHMHFIYEIQE